MKHPKITNILCALVLCATMLFSCSSGDKAALPIPKDAGMVVNIDCQAMSKKLSWEEIKSSDWFKRNQANSTDTFVKQVMEDPKSTGIDFEKNIAFFTKALNSTDSYMSLTGHIRDAAAFEKFVIKANDGQGKPVKEGDINYFSTRGEGTVAWNDNKFLFISLNQQPQWNMDDTTGAPSSPAPVASAKDYAKRLFAMKSDSLISSDKRYATMLEDGADAHLWSNAEASATPMLSGGKLGMLKLDKYLKGTVTTSTINFENGRMVMNAKTFSNDDMMAIYKKHAGNKINSAMIQRLPSENVAAVLAANYKPEMLKELLKFGGLDGLVNGYLGEMDLTLDEIIAASKGDIVFAATDFRMENKSISMGDDTEPVVIQSPNANFIFATTVGDKAAMDKLINVGKQAGAGMRMDSSFNYNMNNELFVFGNNKTAVDQYLQGGSRNMPFLSKINDHPFGAYIDLQKMMAGFGPSVKDSAAKAAFDASVKMWQDIVITGGEIKDNAIIQTIEVNLVDKNTNSLKQLTKYLETLDSKKKGF